MMSVLTWHYASDNSDAGAVTYEAYIVGYTPTFYAQH